MSFGQTLEMELARRNVVLNSGGDPILSNPNLLAYYTDENITESGGTATVWTDASPNGNDLAITGTPTVNTFSDGRQQVNFDGTAGEYFTLNPAGDLDLLPENGTYTIIVEFGGGSDWGNEVLFGVLEGSSTADFQYYLRMDAAADRFLGYAGNDATALDPTTTSNNGRNIVSMTHDGTIDTTILYYEASDVSEESATNAVSNSINDNTTPIFYVGGDPYTGRPLNRPIRNIAIFSTVLSDALRESYQTYLLNKGT